MISSFGLLYDYHNVPLKNDQKCLKYDDSNKKKLYTILIKIMCIMQERKFDSQTLV